MYQKIEMGKHIKKINKVELEPRDIAASTVTKRGERRKK